MRTPIFALSLLALAACGSKQQMPREPVEYAWVRLPAVDGRPAAAYFTLNGGENGDRLIAIDSPRVATIELHETMAGNGAMRMRPLDAVSVGPGEQVSFAPGGRHAMLFGADPNLQPGTPLAINFRFDSGRDISIEATTVAAGAAAPFDEESNGAR